MEFSLDDLDDFTAGHTAAETPGYYLIYRSAGEGNPRDRMSIKIPKLEVRGRTLLVPYQLLDPKIPDAAVPTVIIYVLLQGFSNDHWAPMSDDIEFHNLDTGDKRVIEYPK
jgi:hypothetical protein